jgi:putative ABC transport system ATP-binding protein
MIDVIDVTKSFRMGSDLVHALDEVNLSIEEGDLTAVTGPSGSGKSTLLYTIGGLLTPTRGRVLANGSEVYSLTPRERARFRRENIGFIFQTFELLPYLTALENVILPLLLARVNPENHEDLAMESLEKVGLGNRARHKPGELSGGEQQRVSIARGIVNEPSILLADEPTGNLDRKTGDEITQILHDLNGGGQTIVFVTHDQRKAEEADRVFSMLDGRIVKNIM